MFKFFSYLSLVTSFSLLALSNCVVAATVKLSVNVPSHTPKDATLTLGGDFNSWDPSGSKYQLTKDNGGVYHFTFDDIEIGKVLNFKVTRGSWESVEIADDGSNRDNRRFLVSKSNNHMQATVSEWADLSTKTAPSTVVGTVIYEDIELPTFSGKRKLRIYLPSDYKQSTKRYPVIYMTDAQNLYDNATANAGEWQMDELMERLTKQGSSLTSIIVGIDHAESNRMAEYLPFRNADNSYKQLASDDGSKGEQFSKWLVKELKPTIDKQYRTLSDRDNTTMIGSSMGGLISCYTAIKYQAYISKAACLSSAFLKRLVKDNLIHTIKATGRQLPMRIHMDMGDNEFGLFGKNILIETQEVHDTLLTSGFAQSEIRNQVIQGGTHDEPSWRDRMHDILIWLNARN